MISSTNPRKLPPSLYNYVNELDHIKNLHLQKSSGDWMVKISVREIKEFKFSSDEHYLVDCQKILSSVNLLLENSPLTVYDDEDDDQFIFFEDDDEDNKMLQNDLFVPVVSVFSIGLSSDFPSSYDDRCVVAKAKLFAEILDLSLYPDEPPNFSLELENVSRRFAQETQRFFNSIVENWHLKRLRDPSIESILIKLIDFMDETNQETLIHENELSLCSSSTHSDSSVTDDIQCYDKTNKSPSPLDAAYFYLSKKSSFGNSFDTSLSRSTTLWEEKSKGEPSRYIREFEEMSVLGVGAFGWVTKCRSRILSHNNKCAVEWTTACDTSDSTFFAIKRIPLMSESESENLALQREAANLALLHHPNIVRYYSAWIESIPSFRDSTAMTSSSFTSDTNLRKKSLDKIDIYDSETLSDGTSIRSQRHRIVSSATLGSKSPEIQNESVEAPNRWMSDELSMTPGSTRRHSFPKRYLFIQMEYCSGQTLRKAIESGCLYDKPEIIWNLFRQILDGLGYMHHHGLIHRDLKPCNIFLDGDLVTFSSSNTEKQTTDRNQAKVHVKIGDFGLTTFIGSANPSLKENSSDMSSSAMNLSEGVGTKFYMAPEQEAGGIYDAKADMFSLGVVFFELWHPPFKTFMERAIVLTNLIKNGELPEYFIKNVPKEVPSVLRLLLSLSPSCRPNAHALLHSSLLPHIEPEEFESVYDSIARHAFSAETSHITATLFNRQLQHQIDQSSHIDPHVLPQLGKFSWSSHIVLTGIASRLDSAFRSRGAVRVESPVLFPRSQPATQPLLPSNVPDKTGLLGTSFALQSDHHRLVLLDRHGAPVFFPTRLVLGFARTAPSFLSSGPSVCRRFALQNVQYSSSFDFVMGLTQSNVLAGIHHSNTCDHMHAFYDVGIQLSRALEPDVRNTILKNTSAATKLISKSNVVKLLLFLMRLPFSSTSRSTHRSVASVFRRLYSFQIISLLEAEVVSVTLQSIASLNLRSSICIFWTHGLFLPAFLHEVLGIPLPEIRHFQRYLASGLLSGLSKDEIHQHLLRIPFLPSDDLDRNLSIKRKAEILHEILFHNGTVHTWISMIHQLLAIDGLSVVDLILRHIESLDLLLSSLNSFIYFTPSFIYDDTAFGKGLVFIATSTNQRTIPKIPNEYKGVGKPIIPILRADHKSVRSRISNNRITNLSGISEIVNVDVDSPRFPTIKNPESDIEHSCVLSFVPLTYHLAVGGCYDFMVSDMNPYISWTPSDAVVGVEVAVENLIELISTTLAPTVMSSNIHYTGQRFIPDNKGSSTGNIPSTTGADFKRLTGNQLPQVFIVVLRSEHQVYATSLRLQLLRQGIKCQRRVDRIVDASQFRRRVKAISSIVWVVQIRDHPINGVSYKLQYFGDNTSESDRQVFLQESDVVNFLAECK